MKEIFAINDRVRWANEQMVKEVRCGIAPACDNEVGAICKMATE